jgi:DNA (cytosine-5)-methyltransferase 1
VIYGSVCSGVGAPELAWHELGWQASFMSEIEKFPRAVLKHHWPEVPLHGDFTTIEDQYGPIDLLVGGTPCQSFSVAGLRGGMADNRGNLALEYLRLAQRLRPEWLVWENVPGVLSSNEGRDFGSILGGMAELGYGWAYRVLDAQYFGVPQRRRRVFVVGYLGDWRRAAAVLFERHSLSGDPAPRREAGERIAETLGGSSQSGGFRTTDSDNSGAFIPEVSPALKSRDYKGPSSDGDGDGDGAPLIPEVADPITAHEQRTYTHEGTNFRLRNVIAFSGKDDGHDAGGISPTLRGMSEVDGNANAGGQVAVAIAENQRGEVREMDTVSSLNEGGGKPGQGYPAVAFKSAHYTRGKDGRPSEITPPLSADADKGDQDTAIQQGMSVRRLTPRECERLQGFPDDYSLIPYRNGMAKDGPRYKALGNSMAVPVMKWIGERIQMVTEQ